MPAVAVAHSIVTPRALLNAYFRKVLNIDRTNLVAYWPLDEASGTEARDLSGNGYHGLYTNTPTLANEIGPHGAPVPFFAVANSEYVDCDHAGQANRFRNVDTDLSITLGQEGTIGGWCKVNANSMWTDATNYLAATLKYNTADDIHIKGVDAATDQIAYRRDTSGADSDINRTTMTGTTGYYFTALTWSEGNNQVIAYLRLLGQALETVNTLAAGAWAGADYRDTFLGAYTAGASTWHGHLFGWGVWSTPLSSAQIDTWSAIP